MAGSGPRLGHTAAGPNARRSPRREAPCVRDRPCSIGRPRTARWVTPTPTKQQTWWGDCTRPPRDEPQLAAWSERREQGQGARGGSPGHFVWPEPWSGATEQWMETGEPERAIPSPTQTHKVAGGGMSLPNESPGTLKSLVGKQIHQQPKPTFPFPLGTT